MVRAHGHEVRRFGALGAGRRGRLALGWANRGRGGCRRGSGVRVLCCWTGTGVSIAANKVPGIRAALCGDAETARGAREWNDANVLCLSLRSTSPPVADEILEAWFAGTVTQDPIYLAMIEEVSNSRSYFRLGSVGR